jgi:hypothetical protein
LATAAKKRSRRQNEVFCSATRDIEGMISIEALGPEEWKVTVTGAARTEHRVRVRAADMEDLFAEKPPSVEKLIEESFRFLLEREPNTAILPSFDLPVIARYFPEYSREIAKRIRGCK